jgi:hypothetical protein
MDWARLKSESESRLHEMVQLTGRAVALQAP